MMRFKPGDRVSYMFGEKIREGVFVRDNGSAYVIITSDGVQYQVSHCNLSLVKTLEDRLEGDLLSLKKRLKDIVQTIDDGRFVVEQSEIKQVDYPNESRRIIIDLKLKETE